MKTTNPILFYYTIDGDLKVKTFFHLCELALYMKELAATCKNYKYVSCKILNNMKGVKVC